MKKSIIFLSFCLLIFSTKIFAHPGGHYQKGDGNIYNTWRLNNGEVVKGNFSFTKEDKIFIEQENGSIKSFEISSLIPQDQKLAKLKISKYAAINKPMLNAVYPPAENRYQLAPLLILLILMLLLNLINNTFFKNHIIQSKVGLSVTGVLFILTVFIACSKSETTTTPDPITTPTVIVIPKTTTSFIDSAFSAFKPALSTNWDANYFYIASTGIPSHNMMVGITNWQQQVPIPQPYSGTNSWSIPLQPVYATTPLSTKTNLMKGAVAVAVNGIPIFNALNNRGEDSYKIGELDNWGGHCGKGDDYHYHAAPLHLTTVNGLKPIAFAVDGFSVYGSKEPDGTNMNTLDTCHGHVGTNGVYHYHGTTDYPYVVGAMKGKVTLDPSTTAPENQVIPQAFTKPVRPATSPLSGASITDFVSLGTNSYLLTYKRGTKNGYVKYSWDASNKYTFILTDTAGVAITTTYQR